MTDIYKFDTDTGFEKIKLGGFQAKLEDEDYYVGYIDFKDLEKYDEILHIPERIYKVFSTELKLLQNSLIVHDKYTFGTINIINVDDIFGQRDLIGVYIEKNRFVIIDIKDEDGSIKRAFNFAVNSGFESTSPGRFINNFLKNLISSHVAIYETLRGDVESLDNEVLSESLQKETIIKISELNHVLIELYGNYEQLVDFCEVLVENDNEILTEKDIKYFKFMENRLNRYSSNIQLLREYAAQVRESYQAQMDINLNRVMKIFTVVATVFLPLTLLVGWYGMNFKNMPELSWEHGYKYVIIFSILITAGCLYFFKKRKLI